jgi:uncharacterized protein YjbI with pentapeptide repeats
VNLRLADLRADCARCVGLCCVAPAFSRSADFAIDKSAGMPCPNLADDFRCGIHASLREGGFRGCTVYDCFGAGQRVAQATYAGAHWRDEPEMFEAFHVMRDLHEMLWLLACAHARLSDGALREQVAALAARVEAAASAPAPAVLTTDPDRFRAVVGPLLSSVSTMLRGVGGPDLAGADLAGRSFEDEDLSGATFRGALLVGASFRRAVLDRVDLLGADLRGADLSGARLESALFLSQFQVNGARGDAATSLPSGLDRPPYWAGGPVRCPA